jgi:hypothetical protein
MDPGEAPLHLSHDLIETDRGKGHDRRLNSEKTSAKEIFQKAAPERDGDRFFCFPTDRRVTDKKIKRGRDRFADPKRRQDGAIKDAEQKKENDYFEA